MIFCPVSGVIELSISVLFNMDISPTRLGAIHPTIDPATHRRRRMQQRKVLHVRFHMQQSFRCLLYAGKEENKFYK